MKRPLIIGGVVLLLGIVGIGVYLYNNINPIVKSAIEKNGSAILGTDVSVGSVSISLKSGRGTIRDIRVKNPEGFDSGDVFTLDEITVDIHVASLNKDPIVIDEIRIAAPNANVVLDEQGRSNIAVIKAAADRYQAASAKHPAGKQDAGYEKRFRIEKFSFEEGHVTADATALGKGTIEATLPPLHLTEVGGPAGDAPDAIGKTVTRAFLGAVSISLKSGRGTIRDIRVKNPEGFDSGDVFTLDEITVDIHVASLNKDPIVIDEIRIAAPNANVVLDEQGRSNIAVIKAAADRYQAASAKHPAGKQDAGYEKRFRIEKFSFEEGHVTADATALGKGTIEATLPPLHLTEVGGPAGDAPDAIGKTVTRAFLGAVMGAVGNELKGKALEQGEEAAKKILDKLIN
ncbi:MAG TPA: AsmA family protein [Candidatus Krumholzibacteria bacterium]|nr:AsmA family protein [Candidatus Krumholzibacteria bacterium]